MTKQEMPDRIWAWELHDNMGSSRGWNEKSGWNSVEYRRADLPPTPAEAMRCPEVAAAITAMRGLIAAHASGWIDGADDGAGQRARAAIAALEGVVKHD